MTLRELIDAAAARLDAAGVAFGHGTTNAQDEAAWLALWKLSLGWEALDDLDGITVDAAQAEAVGTLVDERITTRKPTAYLTGEAWLQGVPFFCDERSIVPRSLIAEPLMDGTIERWLPAEPARVLDLCTGNGSLAVLAAMAWPDAQVTATDLSADALALAARNVARHGLQSRITLIEGNGLAALAGLPPFDVILCNPPYVNARSMAQLPAEFRAEPALALAGGDDGMDFIRALLKNVHTHLVPKGVLVLEVGHEAVHFENAFRRLSPVWLDTEATQAQLLLLTREMLNS
jgi:ribosomal protein L3 glutamine methyltransferase